MAKLLFVTVPLVGHVTPVRDVAAQLVRRGHEVTFLTHEVFRPGIERAGIRFVPFAGDAAVSPAEFAAEQALYPPGPEQMNWYFDRLMVSRMTAEHEQIQLLLAEAGEPVVLITDQSCLGGWPVMLGAPGIRPAAFVALGISPLFIPSADVDPLLATPATTDEERARAAASNEMLRELSRPGEERLAKTLAGLGVPGTPPTYLDGYATVCDAILQLYPRGLEFPRTDLPATVRFGGAPHTEAPAAGLPSWWPEVEAARTVIVVTQGTLANQNRAQLLEPAVRALADLDALVVVTTGDDVPFGETPANVRVAGFVPYDLLFAHTDVLVTNGGLGGVLKALGHGVPLVVAGEGEDKPQIANRVEWTGAGVNLRTGTPAPDAIRAAVDTVLREPSYRAAAVGLATEMIDLDPAGELEAIVAELTAR